jgi:hypothetical protein
MKTIEPGMNIARQRRKITSRIASATPQEQAYLEYLVGLFDAGVAADEPQPARMFLPMFHEEFDIEGGS